VEFWWEAAGIVQPEHHEILTCPVTSAAEMHGKPSAPLLPLPLIAIAEKLGNQANASLLSETTVFYLAGILGRVIQDGSMSMLAHDDVRQAVLFLLDELVEHGSSTAYKLRDDFVTPPG